MVVFDLEKTAKTQGKRRKPKLSALSHDPAISKRNLPQIHFQIHGFGFRIANLKHLPCIAKSLAQQDLFSPFSLTASE